MHNLCCITKLYMNKLNVGIRQFTIGSLNLLVLAILSLYMLFRWNLANVNISWSVEISIISVILLIWHLIIIRRMHCHIYSFITVFILLNYIFIFGRVYLVALGYGDDLGWNLFKTNSHINAYRAGLYCLNYVQAIFTGISIQFLNKKSRKNNIVIFQDSSMKNAGILFLIITLPCKMYSDIIQIITQNISGGYVAVVEINGVIGAIAQLFPIAIIFLVVSSLRKKIVKGIIYTYYLYTILVMILSGDRRYALIGMIAVLFCYIKKYEIKVNIWKSILAIVMICLSLTFLTTIRYSRMSGVISISTFFQLYMKCLVEENVIYQLLNEFGLTFYTYMLAIKNIPSIIGYKWGFSFLSAIISVIPGSLRFFYEFIMSNNIYQSIYLIEKQALGGALGQELYGNFGLGAIMIAVLAGILIIRIIGDENTKVLSKQAHYFAMFYFFLNFVRASFAEMIRMICYYYILSFLINFFLENINKIKINSR